ncbi:MAG: c-type cytochrome, partial [Verrucomicrobiae bacterium]|nr:c-type cytochrome [Verrucomicrobiae bacterium]
FWRFTAQRLLVEGQRTDAADALTKRVTANDGDIAAIHALWTLHGLGKLDEATLQAALLAKDARLRRNAIRALGSDAAAARLYFGSGVVTDPDLTTRLAAFVKLAEFSTTPEITTLVQRLMLDGTTRGDEWLSEAAKLLARIHGAAAGFKEGPNLVPNPGFEELTEKGEPKAWRFRNYRGPSDWSVAGKPEAHSGDHSLKVSSEEGADTSWFVDIPLEPRTEYRLSGWIKTANVRGAVGALLNLHGTPVKTNAVFRNSDWVEVETIFNSETRDKISLNALFGGWGTSKGTAWFDDLKLCKLVPAELDEEKALTGDPKRGEEIFWKHPVAACMNCHMLGGKGSPVGPALDGIAGRKDAAYLTQSLLEPNAVLAETYTATPISPMPPMGLILKPQEIEDVKAFLSTLK